MFARSFLWLPALLLLTPTAAAQDEKAGPVFVDGQAQVVPAFKDRKNWIREELWVETSFDSDGDGKNDRVHVDVTRPGQTDTEGLKVPVIYETSPYFAGVGQGDKQYFWNPEHELGAKPEPHTPSPSIQYADRKRRGGIVSNSLVNTWVPRGFAVVHSESPGTGLSQGCPTVGGDNESLAPKAVIDWLNGRAKGFTDPEGGTQVTATKWCTGKVGMTGTSYNGTLPLAAATTGVDGLMAIIPDAPNTSYYHYYRSHGLVRHPGGYMGEDIDVLYEFINSGNPERREWCNRHVRDELLEKLQDRITGDYNDFWAGRDYTNKLDKVKAAVLMVHGFNDWNVMPEHSIRIYAALKAKGVPHMAYFHQGGHGAQIPMRLMNRWFTRFLYDVDNGVEKDPKAWIVREDDKPADPTAYDDYPNPAAKPVTLHLQRGGNQVGALVATKGTGQGTEKLVDDVSITGKDLATAAESPTRLLYATPALTQPIHISGTPKLSIRMTASKPACNLSVWLCALRTRDDKTSMRIITRGWADPQNAESERVSKPLTPGQFVAFTFDLQPDDQVIPVGDKIALMIFSSDRDFTLWPKAGTELTVDLDATTLELPVVDGAAAFGKATGGK
ncbi:MAG: Xaa-Pro dipeptidyl-peptidase [Planctomycetes bacterium]|nr:Xaa-Pro dipeptidyl-peptidase [Planctomycetota bacterium]